MRVTGEIARSRRPSAGKAASGAPFCTFAGAYIDEAQSRKRQLRNAERVGWWHAVVVCSGPRGVSGANVGGFAGAAGDRLCNLTTFLGIE